MSTKKLLSWAAAGVAGFAIITDPVGASRAVETVVGFLRNAGESGQQFVNIVLLG